jgi:putative hydrolase of the HAD superfamily
MIDTILFDLDDTLYASGSGVMEQIRARILTYIETRLHLPTADAEALQRRYFLDYGTSMRGLQLNHAIDADEYLHYVHDIPLHHYLVNSPALDAALASLPHDKVVFTNASRQHAERVLDCLGVRARFSKIVDVRDMAYEGKPQPSAYRHICRLLDVRPESCLLVEDNVRNIQPAKALGMTTVLIHDGKVQAEDSVDYAIRRIEDIVDVLARLRPWPITGSAQSKARTGRQT